MPSERPIPAADPADREEREDAEELEQRRKELQLNRQMSGVLRGLAAQALYLALLGVICLHGNGHETFLQNEAVRHQLRGVNGVSGEELLRVSLFD